MLWIITSSQMRVLDIQSIFILTLLKLSIFIRIYPLCNQSFASQWCIRGKLPEPKVLAVADLKIRNIFFYFILKGFTKWGWQNTRTPKFDKREHYSFPFCLQFIIFLNFSFRRCMFLCLLRQYMYKVWNLMEKT